MVEASAVLERTIVLPVAREFIGASVINFQDEDLGRIEDLMVDAATGRTTYAVLSFGGFLGIGDKLFAVPWEALAFDRSQKTFLLNINQEALKNAPGFDRGNWPNMADQHWGSDIHSYYGLIPYWDYHARLSNFRRDPASEKKQ